MSINNISVEVFVANECIYNGGNLYGSWIKLPISGAKLQEELNKMLGIDSECIIIDVKSDLNCSFKQTSDIYKLNEQLLSLKNADINVVEAILSYDSLSIDELVDIIKNKRYELYEDIRNEEDLGKKLYTEGKLTFKIPKDIASYIDFKAIGHDLCIKNQIHIIKEMGVAERIFI